MANTGIDPSAYLGAAGISAGASVGGSIIGAVANYASQQQAFKQNKELMRMQNQYNVDQWNRENAYNSPEAQVARLRAAGLNPDLMYGNGTTSTGMASQLSGKRPAKHQKHNRHPQSKSIFPRQRNIDYRRKKHHKHI